MVCARRRRAQDPYPSKVVRIVTAAPGSNNDWGARLLGDEISPSLGHRVIVENRGGLAAEVVAKAPPDGYTVLFYGPAAWTCSCSAASATTRCGTSRRSRWR